MPTALSGLIRRLKVDLAADGEAMTDGALLERFVSMRDEAAFAGLVRRHGPMVLGVCRRLLRDPHEVEDAFQATFLVAVRKAASVRPREMFGNWLYGVAYRTAREARARLARRRTKEKQTDDMPHPPQADPEADWDELRRLLDQELSRLPEKYRAPVILCELEGRSRRDVAKQLRLPEGTLSSRLATARKTLARRLSRHGPALSAATLAGFLADGASAAVPPGLARSAVMGAALLGAGSAEVAAVAPPHVVALTEGVLKAMLLTKLKIASLFVLAVAFVAAGAGATGYRAFAADEERNGPAEERVDDKPKDKRRPAAEDQKVIRGSGKEVTQDMKMADFTSVEVGGPFHVEITRGKEFRVTVTADDNVMPYVKVARKGSGLEIGLDSKGLSFQNVTLKAAVVMPALEKVSAAGASHVSVRGFKSEKDCKVEVSGASHLSGDIQAQTVNLEASGASHISLKGSAKRAHLTASGASHLALSDFVIGEKADVTLSGACHADIQVKGELDYDVSGVSHLRYSGEPKVGKKKVTGLSSVTSSPRKPADKKDPDEIKLFFEADRSRTSSADNLPRP
jgi:RNA polymerase sigma factor (sigma-70 family)